jgi:hypothetical protein
MGLLAPSPGEAVWKSGTSSFYSRHAAEPGIFWKQRIRYGCGEVVLGDFPGSVFSGKREKCSMTAEESRRDEVGRWLAEAAGCPEERRRSLPPVPSTSNMYWHRRLPHWVPENYEVFVTWRLAGFPRTAPIPCWEEPGRRSGRGSISTGGYALKSNSGR